MATTNKDILDRLLEIEQKLPNGELEDLKIHLSKLSTDQKEHATKMEDVHTDVTELKQKLLDPEDGLVVKINKNTYWRKTITEGDVNFDSIKDDVKDLNSFKSNVTKALWVVYTTIMGVIIKLIWGE